MRDGMLKKTKTTYLIKNKTKLIGKILFMVLKIHNEDEV